MGRLIKITKKYAVMQRHTQAGKITTNFKVIKDFNLPELSGTKKVVWNCHVYDSANGRYYMILGGDILT